MDGQNVETGSGAQIPAQDQTPKPEPTTQEQIEAALKAERELWKKEIAGLNRRNSELEKAKQEQELAHLKDEDRVKREAEIAAAERDKAKAEAEAYRNDLIKTKALLDVGLPTDFAKHINGKTEEEIITTAKEFSALVKKTADAAYQQTVKEKLGGEPPVGGSAPLNTTLQAAYDQAKQKNDVALMTAIQRQANREGQQIKI